MHLLDGFIGAVVLALTWGPLIVWSYTKPRNKRTTANGRIARNGNLHRVSTRWADNPERNTDARRY